MNTTMTQQPMLPDLPEGLTWYVLLAEVLAPAGGVCSFFPDGDAGGAYTTICTPAENAEDAETVAIAYIIDGGGHVGGFDGCWPLNSIDDLPQSDEGEIEDYLLEVFSDPTLGAETFNGVLYVYPREAARMQ